QSVVDRLRELAADAMDLRQVVDTGACHALQPSELPQQLAALARPEPRDRLQHGMRPSLGAALPMTGDREAVRLVADALDKVQRRRIGGQDARLLFAGEEQALLPWPAIGALGDAGHAEPID